MYRVDGGNFSNDVLARMRAGQTGSMSNNDLAQTEQDSQNATQAGMNMAPTVGSMKIAGEAAPFSKLIGKLTPQEYVSPALDSIANNPEAIDQSVTDMTKQQTGNAQQISPDVADQIKRLFNQ